MLRTNSKAVISKIHNYIVENYDGSGYDLAPTTNFDEICANIWGLFYKEMVMGDRRRASLSDYWEDYCSGLPSILCCDYYVRGSTVDLLGDMLEQTKEEREKYTEEQAEKRFTYLLFREINKHAHKIGRSIYEH